MSASFELEEFNTSQQNKIRKRLMRPLWFKRWRPSLSREQKVPLVYVGALGAFEAVSILLNAVVGNILHAILMLWLVYRGSTHQNRNIGKLLLCISVCPMIRLVSLAVSPNVFQGMWYYCISEGIVLLSAIFAVAINGFTLNNIGLGFDKHLWTMPLVLLSGFVVGWMESHIVHASPLAPGISLQEAWFPILMVVVFTGLTEEFIFRGLIQYGASLVYKPSLSIPLTAVLWAFLHLGWSSWLEMLFVTAVGLLWGIMKHFNKGILTLALSHGIANVMVFVVIPYLK